MLLLSHVLIALAGMAVAALAAIAPSQPKLRASYALAGLTLATGTALLMQSPSHLVSACVTGLIYFGIVGAVIAFARRKLAMQAAQAKR